jgi:hypothetical protein
MSFKILAVIGFVLVSASAVAQRSTQDQNPPNQNQQQPQTPTSSQPNAQGEQPPNARAMQEKDTGLTNQSGGAGTAGSTGSQSESRPNTGTTAK